MTSTGYVVTAAWFAGLTTASQIWWFAHRYFILVQLSAKTKTERNVYEMTWITCKGENLAYEKQVLQPQK